MTAVTQTLKTVSAQNVYKLAKLFKVAAILSMRTDPELQP